MENGELLRDSFSFSILHSPFSHLLNQKLGPPIHRSPFFRIVVADWPAFAVTLVGKTLAFYSAIDEVLHYFKRPLGR